MNLEKDVYNQGCKERQTQLGRKGDVIRSGFVPLVETQEKKALSQDQRSSLGIWGLMLHIRNPSSGDQHWKDESH